MNQEKGNSYRLLWMLGAAMTLPMILLSGPIAGYAIGHYLLVKYFHQPAWVTLLLVGLGFFASAMQSYRLIKRIKKLDKS